MRTGRRAGAAEHSGVYKGVTDNAIEKTVDLSGSCAGIVCAGLISGCRGAHRLGRGS